MENEEFPSCCGIDVITGLYGSTEEVYDASMNNGEGGYRPWRKSDTIQELRDFLLETKGASRGLVLAVTNKDKRQVRSAELLKKFGFKELRKFKNPRHRSKLTIWELEISKLTKAQINKKAKDLCAQLAKK